MAEHAEPNEQPAQESAATDEAAGELAAEQLEEVAGGTNDFFHSGAGNTGVGNSGG